MGVMGGQMPEKASNLNQHGVLSSNVIGHTQSGKTSSGLPLGTVPTMSGTHLNMNTGAGMKGNQGRLHTSQGGRQAGGSR